MDGFGFLTNKSREWRCLHWTVAWGSIIFVWLELMTAGQGPARRSTSACCREHSADPAKQAVDLSVVRQLSSSLPTLGPLLPIRRDGLLSSRGPHPPSPPNHIACQANLAELPPMIILSAVVSPAAEEEAGRSEAGVLPRGNNEQRPISHKLAARASRATSQAADQRRTCCLQNHPRHAQPAKGKAQPAISNPWILLWHYNLFGMTLIWKAPVDLWPMGA